MKVPKMTIPFPGVVIMLVASMTVSSTTWHVAYKESHGCLQEPGPVVDCFAEADNQEKHGSEENGHRETKPINELQSSSLGAQLHSTSDVSSETGRKCNELARGPRAAINSH